MLQMLRESRGMKSMVKDGGFIHQCVCVPAGIWAGDQQLALQCHGFGSGHISLRLWLLQLSRMVFDREAGRVGEKHYAPNQPEGPHRELA